MCVCPPAASRRRVTDRQCFGFVNAPGVPSLCHRETAKVDRACDGAFRDMHHDVHRGLALDTAFIVVPVSLSIHRHERPPVFKSSMAICPSSSWVTPL